MIIYLHGFISAPASKKARALEAYLQARGLGDRFVCPVLPDSPEAAVQSIEAAYMRHAARGPTFVGSSLGGFYATWLAERHGLKAVLVNPAVRPYEGLRQYLGEQQNLYTGERYELSEAHLEELRQMDVAAISRPERYLLMVETGDEVLDYRQAVERYRGCRQMVIEGGDHGFSDFGEYLDDVLGFCGMQDLKP